jgi:hypothetical protein
MSTITTPIEAVNSAFMFDPFFPRLEKLVPIRAIEKGTGIRLKVCKEVLSNLLGSLGDIQIGIPPKMRVRIFPC